MAWQPPLPAFTLAAPLASPPPQKRKAPRHTSHPSKWRCRKPRPISDTNSEHRTRSRAAKRTAFYDAMKLYNTHFSSLLEAELAAEQAAVREKTSHSPNPNHTLHNLLPTPHNRLFSHSIFKLSPTPPDTLLPPTHTFSKGDLLDLHPANTNYPPIQATILEKRRSHFLIAIPVGTDPANLLTTLATSHVPLRIERGTSTIAFDRALTALTNLTTPHPSATALSKLLVTSFSPTPIPPHTQSPSQPHTPPSSPWRALAAERVTSLKPDVVAAAMRDVRAAGLNGSQCAAIRTALRCRLSLVQGPPGTGKTVTAAYFIGCAVRLRLGPVLAVAGSNVAADNLLRKVRGVGKMRAVRVGRVATVGRDLWEVCVEGIVERSGRVRRLREGCLKGKVGVGELVEGERRVEKGVLDGADVVVCTCVGSGREEVVGRRFGVVVVDEATQVTEPEVGIALVGKGQVVLVGDPCQLGPTVVGRERGLERSLFERLWEAGVECSVLDVQYRMHPEICKFVGKRFYFGRLRNGVTREERMLPMGFGREWRRVTFLDVGGGEERDGGMMEGKSFLNRMEARAVEEVVRTVIGAGRFEARDVGVISAYAGQMRLLMEALDEVGVEVGTVDGFQGREKEVVIVSTVRSNPEGQVGFVADWRRLNVAVTRARRLLVVVGDQTTLGNDPLWHEWIQWARRFGRVLPWEEGVNIW